MAENNSRAARRRPPSQLYLCTVICGDRTAGRLMSWILSWSRKATPKWGRDGLWNANPRTAALSGSSLTLMQYRRCRQLLVERGLADIETGWFDGREMVFTRPTAAFLAAYAAQNSCTTHAKIGCPEAAENKGGFRARHHPDNPPTTLPQPALTTFLPSGLLSKENSEYNFTIYWNGVPVAFELFSVNLQFLQIIESKSPIWMANREREANRYHGLTREAPRCIWDRAPAISRFWPHEDELHHLCSVFGSVTACLLAK